MTFNDELRRVFKEEATELIEALMDLIAQLTRSEDTVFRERLNDTLRTAHNLKGAATSTGFGIVETLAHALEGALGGFKGFPGPLPQDITTLAIESLGVMQAAVDGDVEDSEILEVLERLVAFGGEILEPRSINGNDDDDAEDDGSEQPDERPRKDSEAPGIRDTAIRVNTSRLDQLMGFLGEFLSFRSRLADRHHRHTEIFKALQGFAKIRPENQITLDPILGELRRLVREGRKDLLDFENLTDAMGDTAKQLRTVPLRGAVHVWRRIVRESCQIAGKDAKLEIDVGKIEIDRYVLERIHDPVMHILRNAVDHGIESPTVRADQNKPSAGCITVSAALQGSMIRLAVSDDGQGINFEKVRQKAVERHLISEEGAQQLSDAQIADLLFYTGFSTASQVSRLSGRGVGLDVVRGQLEELGGSVEIETNPARQGLTVVLWVPVSILSSEGLFVRVGETCYALPVESVLRTIRVRHDQLQTVDGRAVIKEASDNPFHVARLANVMGVTAAAPLDVLNVVVLARGRMRLGLIVDEVVGIREYVIQALPWNLKDSQGLSGAILQADGTVVLLIDILHLFLYSDKRNTASLTNPTPTFRHRVLLVDDSLSSRTLQQAMLRSDGYDVSLAADGQEAWQLLQDETFDLVVSDIQMPNVDGFELTRRIRNSARLRDLPVILVTSLASSQDREAGAEAGADDYLVKGTFDQNALLSIVNKYLGGP